MKELQQKGDITIEEGRLLKLIRQEPIMYKNRVNNIEEIEKKLQELQVKTKNDTLRKTEFAGKMGVSRQTLHRWIRDGVVILSGYDKYINVRETLSEFTKRKIQKELND